MPEVPPVPLPLAAPLVVAPEPAAAELPPLFVVAPLLELEDDPPVEDVAPPFEALPPTGEPGWVPLVDEPPDVWEGGTLADPELVCPDSI